MSVYKEPDEQDQNRLLTKRLDEDSELKLIDIQGTAFYTTPAHYTEASLVKQLEELGIGRPSTYAPTITTIISRHYVAKENKIYMLQELGEAVNNIMKKAFTSIVDVNFTANMETLLDSVEEGKIKLERGYKKFYPDLDEAVVSAEKELENVKIADEVSDVVCELCGSNMVVKYGPHMVNFLAVQIFQIVRNTKPYLEKIGVLHVLLCGKEVVLRKTKKEDDIFGC